jgi:hypothetical protein
MLGGLWLILIGAWFPALNEAITAKPPSRALLATALLLGSLAVLASMCWGLVLALLRRWDWILVSAVAGTAVLIGWYGMAMIAGGDPHADDEAGAGAAIFSVPTFLLVGLLLAAGGGLGSAYRRLRTRHRAIKTVAE